MTVIAPYIMTILLLMVTLIPTAYAKGKPENPGKSGDAPGQSTSADTPSRSGDSPGNSADAFGQLRKVTDTLVRSEGAPGQIRSSDVKNAREDTLDAFLNLSEPWFEEAAYARVVIANSSKYQKLKTQMEMILLAYKTDLLTKSEARKQVVKCLNKMAEEVADTTRFLGFLFPCKIRGLCR